jgi:hypothetical protein
MVVEEGSPALATITCGDVLTQVPRYWLARMLHRVALHGLRMGYAETYGGFFVDDRADDVRFGLRGPPGKTAASVSVPRAEALAVVERLYRAVAPPGYTEHPS